MCRISRFAFAILVCCSLQLSSGALAQTLQTDEFSASSFFPAAGAQNYLMVDGALINGRVSASAGGWFDYAHRPLVIQTQCGAYPQIDCTTVGTERDIVQTMSTFSFVGALSFSGRFQVGAYVPFSIVSGEDLPYRVGTNPNLDIAGGTRFGLGDPRFSTKIELVSAAEERFGLATVAWVGLPVGQLTAEHHYIGESGITAGGHVAIEWRGTPVRAAINVGGVYRPEGQLVGAATASQLTYGGAAGFQLTQFMEGILEVTGATRFGEPDEKLEGRAALRIALGSANLTVGGGMSVIRGVASPYFRGFASLGWVPRPPADIDGDGVTDDVDACPSTPEDRDGFADEDGCPEIDNDEDGFADDDDQCANDAEDMDGHEDSDGCPELDNDGDGIQDEYDSCPDTPEDMDGDRDNDGCPDNDRDRDGVRDNVDQCPEQPEDTDGLGDDDGCPEDDFDSDGVLDIDDECPEQPEDIDGDADQDGCPEEGRSRRRRR